MPDAPAARTADPTSHGGTLTGGLPTVLIGDRPAARLGDPHVCPVVDPGPKPHLGGLVSAGSPTVLIGDKPAARQGDACVCPGPPNQVAAGEPKVTIGG